MSGFRPRSTSQAASAPSPTTWRRERLMRISSSASFVPQTMSSSRRDPSPVPTENSLLRADESGNGNGNGDRGRSYGTLPNPRRRFFQKSRPHLPKLDIQGNVVYSNPTSPTFTPSFFRDLSRLSTAVERPISAYDAPFTTGPLSAGLPVSDMDAKINGVRVWYSSFSSVDWLHDAIKDSLRFAKLRRRKSLKAKVRLLIDKSLGWVIVTIVGFLTAIVAFLVVRSEQWLFDLKEGYCRENWLRAKRYCCPPVDERVIFLPHAYNEEGCAAWKPWSEVVHLRPDDALATVVDYLSYTTVAVGLAVASCLLTIYLTNSTTFATRKESGVLSPDFHDPSQGPKHEGSVAEPKRKVMYYAAGSGIPEIKTILSGFVIHGYLGGRVLFTKSVGLALSVASGLSLGKEGPFVHIASCIGNIVSRIHSKYENNEAKRREILSAACAAGVAVAFGAPIGGTLFSLEEVSYFFPPKVMWRSFFCAMIAAITLKMLDPFNTGKLVLFQVTYDKDWHGYELLPFLLLGVFGGVYGAYFSKLNYRWSRYVRNGTWLKAHPIIEVLLITLITTCLCFLNPFTRMGGTELVYNLFAECRTGSGNNHNGLCVNPGSFDAIWPVVQAILTALIVKSALTVVTFGIKVPAGIFIPTLGVGACAGRVLGIFMQYLQLRHPDARLFRACSGDLDCIVPGLYAMVGAAATLSGVTRTTVSLAVIMFELTDTLTYAVPIMLAVLVAKTVADALEPKGIYDLVIELSQLPFLDTKHEYLWGNFHISDVIARDAEVIRLDRTNTVKSLIDQLHSLGTSGQDDGGLPILRQDPQSDGLRLVAYIGANELEHALSIVADNGDDEVRFRASYEHHQDTSSISSLMEGGADVEQDLFDFSIYMDQSPLSVQSNAPLEMVHQFFVKLGARYVLVVDMDGYYEGLIDKKTWLAFLSELENKS